jgi:hypothetical protein
MMIDEQSQSRGSGILILSIILGLTTLVSLFLVGLNIGQRSVDSAQKSAERRAVVADAITYACTEIEKLKSGEREAAWKSYRNLAKNLKLLHLARTPALEKAAVDARDDKLRRYHAVSCPINGQIR